MIEESKKVQFKMDCEKYLSSISLEYLRAYGRSLQLKDPTKKKKAELITEIIRVLCGEHIPHRNKKGAPIKNEYIAPQILEDIEKIKRRYTLNEAESENGEGETRAPKISLQFTVELSHLNERQKKLLNDFLSSLWVFSLTHARAS